MNIVKLWILITILCFVFNANSAEDHQHESDIVISHDEKDHQGHVDDEDDHNHVKDKDDQQNEGHGHDEDSHGDEHDDEGDEHSHSHEEEATDVELNDSQRRLAGIETLSIIEKPVGEAITAPGEVILNAYRTAKVTPRISAQVVSRHVRLGDLVKEGQPLVTLSSVEMAEAQGELLEANIEWRRVKKLGRKVVSEKRFITAEVAHQQAVARVMAFGMTNAQIETLLKKADVSKATGEFKLLSSQDGTVISDAFVTGEIIEPGHVLFEISDESLLWVEARLTPEDANQINIGAPAKIKTSGIWMEGKVTQARHTLDETTRTLSLHLEVPNPDDSLHPGQFVTAVIEGKDKKTGIAIPLAAVLRGADGDWQVFVETAPGRFEPKEIEVLRTIGDQIVIEGIAEGTTIVSKGAFFVQSEIAKGGFEVHNH